MKKLVLFVCLSVTILISHAQFNSGQKVIGGQFNFNTSGQDQSITPQTSLRSTFGGISLSLSKFKSPTVLQGFGILYGHSYSRSYTGPGGSEQKSNSNFIGAFINSTKLQPLAKKLYLSFTATVQGSYQFGKTVYIPAGAAEIKTTGYNASLGGSMGVMYQLSPKFLVSGEFSNLLSVAYSHNKASSASAENTTNTFGFYTGLGGFTLNNLNFGVRYLL